MEAFFDFLVSIQGIGVTGGLLVFFLFVSFLLSRNILAKKEALDSLPINKISLENLNKNQLEALSVLAGKLNINRHLDRLSEQLLMKLLKKHFENEEKLIEQNQKRFNILVGLVLFLGVLLFVGFIYNISPHTSFSREPYHIAYIIDSSKPEAVYDTLDVNISGSNTDDIRRILQTMDDFNGFDIQIAEATGNGLSNADEILKKDPELIIIHFHCFGGPTEVLNAQELQYSFMDYANEVTTKTKFLVYSRGNLDIVEDWLEDLPNLKGKVKLLELSSSTTFKKMDTELNLKKAINELMNF